MANNTIRIGKCEAGKQQLRTAIKLWFKGGDPVSAHALAFAAYEIFHFLSEKRDPTRRDLLFDTATIKDEFRKDWNQLVRKEANFFKHADRDGDAVIEFDPAITEHFILFAIGGRELCGEASSDEERAFIWWIHVNRPERLTNKGADFLAKNMPVDSLKHIRDTPKHEFFDRYMKGVRAVGA
jgi:hypothetical protein